MFARQHERRGRREEAKTEMSTFRPTASRVYALSSRRRAAPDRIGELAAKFVRSPAQTLLVGATDHRKTSLHVDNVRTTTMDQHDERICASAPADEMHTADPDDEEIHLLSLPSELLRASAGRARTTHRRGDVRRWAYGAARSAIADRIGQLSPRVRSWE